jgi:PP-loop superfamily ATP-utilizing enzyme
VGSALGYNTVKGSCLNTLEPQPEKVRLQNVRKIEKQARRFYTALRKQKRPVPSMMKLAMFRFSRTSMKKMLSEEFRDYTWYRDKGWFTSDYYYPVKLNPIKKIVACLVDTAAGGMK